MKDLLISIVAVKFTFMLEQAIDSIVKYTKNIDYDIFLVDNSPNGACFSNLSKKYSQLKIIQISTPQGFSSNHNIVLKKNFLYRYVVLLNDDVLLLKNIFETLIKDMDSCKNIGISGPMLLYPDKSVQPSCGMFPTLETIAYDFLGLKSIFRNSKRVNKYIKNYIDYSKPQYVQWISGCCFVIKREVIEQIGSFDEDYFLFCEDTDYCYRAMNKGWKIYYNPKVELIHYEGSSTNKKKGKKNFNPHINAIRLSSKVIFAKKHYPFYVVFGSKILLLLHILLVFLKWSIMGFFDLATYKQKLLYIKRLLKTLI